MVINILDNHESTVNMLPNPRPRAKRKLPVFLKLRGLVRDGAPFVEAGQDIFDGKGGITNTYTDTTGQTVVTKGSYQMNANCVSQAKYDDSGVNYVMYTGPTGSEFSWISVTPGTKITGREVRVSTSLTPKCSLKTLKGTYVYSHIGYRDGVQYIESGQEVFDGKGSIRTPLRMPAV
jgi:hypothetical protein